MILGCNYEEVSALSHGARTLIGGGLEDRSAVVAPPASIAAVEAFIARLEGDMSIGSLSEQRRAEMAVGAIVDCLRAEMETVVAVTHPADEGAVAAYFEFAHAFSVLTRLRDMGREMAALIELVTGQRPTQLVADTFAFPD